MLRLLLWRFILRISNSLQINTKLLESLLYYSIFSSAYKAVKSIVIILLVTNQSKTNCNAARQSSTALSHIYWVLYQSEHILLKKDHQKECCSTFFEFYNNQKHKKCKERFIKNFITRLLSHKAFRNKS